MNKYVSLFLLSISIFSMSETLHAKAGGSSTGVALTARQLLQAGQNKFLVASVQQLTKAAVSALNN